MWPNHVSLLRCPTTKRKLHLVEGEIDPNGKVKSGFLVEEISGNRYPVVDYIPRFVPAENYAGNFGFQWNLHRLTQHDSHSGLDASEKRFWLETRWNRDLSGQLVLEGGSGSGRFTRYPLDAGATVVSFDYSNAVDANYKMNGQHKNLLIVQADMFSMPFEDHFFDLVFCFGVLQHTPDPEKAFLSLTGCLKFGGKIATDVYRKSIIAYYLNPYYYVRPFTRSASPEKLYRLVKGYIDWVWPLARIIRKIPRGSDLNRKLLMVADRSDQFPNASDATLKEWAYLDTFDWLSPRYDFPQTSGQYKKWHEKAGLTKIEVHRGYNGFEGRAEKKQK